MNEESGQPRKRSGGGRAFHSRLESFVDFIRELRQQRKTWQEIAAALTSDKNCTITAQGVHQFYRRKLKRRAKGHWEDAGNDLLSPPAPPNPAASRPQPRPAPLPPEQNFKRPQRFNLEI